MPLPTEYPPIQPGNWASINAWLASGWTTLSKGSDETRTGTTTLANDSVMQFPMAASTNYRVRGQVFFDTTANGDFKYALTAPGSPTLVRGVRTSCIAGGTPAIVGVVDLAAVGSTSLAGAGTTGGYVGFEFIWQNGVNAGIWAFQWAQDTSDGGNTIVRAGSYIQYQVA